MKKMLILALLMAAPAFANDEQTVRDAGEIHFLLDICGVTQTEELREFKARHAKRGMSGEQFDALIKEGNVIADGKWQDINDEQKEYACMVVEEGMHKHRSRNR